MLAIRCCWWCGFTAEVNTNLPESNGLLRDDSTMDGSESWICADSRTCNARAMKTRAPPGIPHDLCAHCLTDLMEFFEWASKQPGVPLMADGKTPEWR
jgi:hypothetical protein